MRNFNPVFDIDGPHRDRDLPVWIRHQKLRPRANAEDKSGDASASVSFSLAGVTFWRWVLYSVLVFCSRSLFCSRKSQAVSLNMIFHYSISLLLMAPFQAFSRINFSKPFSDSASFICIPDFSFLFGCNGSIQLLGFSINSFD